MSRPDRLVTPVLIAGCIIILVSFAIRSSFGVFQIPVAFEFGWPRAEFSLAIAIQNLAWGFGQPFFGALAEKMGDRVALVSGAVLYAVGLVLTAFATTPLGIQLLEVLVGFGIAGTGFGVILAVVGRAASDRHRSMALAITTAAGSAGQVFGPPLANLMLLYMTWQTIFLWSAVAILAVMAVLPMIKAPEPRSTAELEASLGQILKTALRDPSYLMIFAGFFSCGYQLGFITAHFPAMITEMSSPIPAGGLIAAICGTSTAALGAVSISVIGFFNIFGTLTAGWAGNRWAKKHVLAAIYVGRTVAAAVFIMLPITPMSVLVFSAVMGSLWLATVPVTSGLVAYIYGLRFMATLYGIVFFSHQLGSFIGIWLGGRMYDATGDYTAVWWVGVGVGAFSALIHLPIREAPRRMVVAE